MSIPSWAVRGAKVVCVRDDDFGGAVWCGSIQRNAIYTVSEVRVDHAGRGPHLVLAEAPNYWGTKEVGWRIARFRPLINQDDDLEAHFNVYLKNDQNATRRVGEDA